MNDDQFWDSFQASVSHFCLSKTIDYELEAMPFSLSVEKGTIFISVYIFCISQPDEIKITLFMVPIEFDSYGSHNFLFMVNDLKIKDIEIKRLQRHCESFNDSIASESSVSRNLRRQLQEFQVAAHDAEWRLQENIASLHNQVNQERQINQELRSRLSVPRESSTDRGRTSVAVDDQDVTGGESGSNFGDDTSQTTAASFSQTTPVGRESFRRPASSAGDSTGFSNGNGSSSSALTQRNKLLKVAERLNITPITEYDFN
jgi:hypothetical protein